MRRKTKIDARARKKAEYLATLPKHPVKRFFYRLHPARLAKFWFSREGAMTLLKLAGIGLVIGAILVGALFAYYRRELDSIRPGEISKRVQTTVTKYYDRNNQLLWEDKGDGDYKVVVESKNISEHMKQATIAIEDKDFYKHGGFSITGLTRAVINNARGGSTQGGSTLTQQLVKNVFFANEASDRSWTGVPRKIKEVILAIEVERMYNKDQILTLYLNEVPYGGRHTGVESAARTYFGKSAKDLNIAESALLAGIPQQPSYYNPYTLDPDSSRALIARQHTVIDNMANQKFITKQEAEEAKKVPILDTIKPEISANENIQAPHFVLEVRNQLEREFGQKLVRSGGLVVKTTLDKRAQDAAEKAVQAGRENFRLTNINNMSLSSVDVETGQVIAMVGSVDFNDASINGQTNYATSPLQPGSSIKPFDYAALFMQRPGTNYGPGSLFQDRNINDIYCRGNVSGSCDLNNFTGRFYGTVSVREALGNSLNTVAVQAMHIAGVNEVVKLARESGDGAFCTNLREEPTLSAAIGGGCTARPVEHTNAYATFARGGVYKPLSYILEVKNAQGETLKQWKDQSKQVMDPQIAYMISDVLSDVNARMKVFGASGRSFGFVVPGVKSASKTGTSDDGQGHALDNWMMSYSPKVSVGVWTGRHDGTQIGRGDDSSAARRAVNDYMAEVHKIYEADGRYKPNDWLQRPAGIQDLTVNGRKDIWPSWYKKPQDAEGIKMIFDRVSKKKAVECTPERAKVEVVVQSIEDPSTRKKLLMAPDGYDPNADDDRHKCDDIKPFVSLEAQNTGNNTYRITATVNQGTFPLQSLDIAVDGQVVSSQAISGPGSFTVNHAFTSPGQKNITATVIDQGWYEGSATRPVTVSGGGNNPPGPGQPVFPNWFDRD